MKTMISFVLVTALTPLLNVLRGCKCVTHVLLPRRFVKCWRRFVGAHLGKNCRSSRDSAGRCSRSAQSAMARILAGWNRLRIAGYHRKPVLHACFATWPPRCGRGHLFHVSSGNDSARGNHPARTAHQASGGRHGSGPGCGCAAKRLNKHPKNTEAHAGRHRPVIPENISKGCHSAPTRIMPAAGALSLRGAGEEGPACSVASSEAQGLLRP